MAWTAEYGLFLAIGLAILVFEAHRQFNEPSYSRPSGEDDTVIYGLSPSEIRSRSAFVSAELVYIAVIVALYLLFLLNEAFQRVAGFIMNFVAQGTTGGQAPQLGAPPTGEGTGAVVLPGPAQPGSSAIENAAVPFVVAVTLVTALRFPGVRRLEVMLRSFTHKLFGIPRIPAKLRQKIEDTSVDLAAIERDLPAEARRLRYHERMTLFVDAARQALPDDLGLDEFRKNLGKVAAYQIWVRDLRIWPSAEFRSNFKLFKDLNEPLLGDISALMQDLDLLAAPGAKGEADAAAGAAPDEAGRRGMQRELWKLKVRQAERLARRVSEMMALYDQNSNWPDAGRPEAASLRRFLEAVRSDDEARTFQINLAIVLVVLSIAVNAVAGYLSARWLESIAAFHGFKTAGDQQFDGMRTARDFAISALIVYGLATWLALQYRSRSLRRGAWRNFFDARSAIPPMTHLLPLALVVGAAVFTAAFAYFYGGSTGWDVSPPPAGEEEAAAWWKNFARQRDLAAMFALVGMVHGAAVAVMMDLGRRQFESYVWIAVIVVYILMLGGLGFAIGGFVSSDAFLGVPKDDLAGRQAAAIRPDARSMREALYAFDLALIALMTSFALTSFLRPGPRPAGGALAAEAQP